MHLREKKKLGAERKYLEQYWEQDMEQNLEHDMEHSHGRTYSFTIFPGMNPSLKEGANIVGGKLHLVNLFFDDSQ